MNINSFREKYGEDNQLLIALIDALMAEGPQRIGEIEQAMQQQDAEAVRSAAHTLKGAVAIFEAEQVVATAQGIETDAQDGQLDAVQEKIDVLKSQTSELLASLEAIKGS